MVHSTLFERTSKFLLISLLIALFSLAGLQLVDATTTAGACTPDFTLTASNPVTIAAGSFSFASFTATSECGLSGTLFWHASVSPNVSPNAGIGLHQPTYHPVVISSTHPSGGESFQVVTTSSTVKTTYTVTFTVTIDEVVHTVNVIVTVNGYSITVSPSTVSAPLGQPVQSTITLTSYGGYSATIYYVISVSPDTGFGSDSCFNPVPGGPTISSATPTATSQWTCTITPAGTYTVTIMAMPINGVPAPELSTTVTVTVK